MRPKQRPEQKTNAGSDFRTGRAGVLIDGDSVYSIEADTPGEPTPRSRADILHLLHGAEDVTQLDETNPEEARATLAREHNREIALRMSLILLDGNAPAEARTLAAECVEERLDGADGELTRWLLARLYQAPLPESADLAGALEISSRAGFRGDVSAAGSVRRTGRSVSGSRPW